jgi:hypothetical protein
MKERTHLQTQWKKSGALDMSLKDWVVLSADDTTAKVRLLATQLGLYYIIIYCKRNQTARANSIPPRSIPDSQVKREGGGGGLNYRVRSLFANTSNSRAYSALCTE